MCRNIRPLFNFDPPATKEEITKASEQFVRKVSGFTKPSKANEEIYKQSVEKITKIIQDMFSGMTTSAKPKNREKEAEERRILNEKRFNRRDII